LRLKFCMNFYIFRACYMTRPSLPHWCDLFKNVSWRAQIVTLLFTQFFFLSFFISFPSLELLPRFQVHIFCSASCSQTSSVYGLYIMATTNVHVSIRVICTVVPGHAVVSCPSVYTLRGLVALWRWEIKARAPWSGEHNPKANTKCNYFWYTAIRGTC
jgi:hypothetical protein